MGVGTGTKKMANSIAAADDSSFAGRIKSWPERVKSFYNDVRTEMRKVTTPSRKEVQATTTVVIVAVFIFGLYFWVIDNVIGRGVDYLFRFFTK
jgi:preprotein translocase subunit SecE